MRGLRGNLDGPDVDLVEGASKLAAGAYVLANADGLQATVEWMVGRLGVERRALR